MQIGRYVQGLDFDQIEVKIRLAKALNSLAPPGEVFKDVK